MNTYIRRYSLHPRHDNQQSHKAIISEMAGYLRDYSSEYIVKVLRVTPLGKELGNPQGVAEKGEAPVYTEFIVFEIEVETGLLVGRKA